jgi:hypothetical protein
MADVFGLETYGASPDRANGDFGTVPSTGDLRRKYNFGDRISELSIAQDPFFRFVSQVAKKPTDDPEFKFTEQRHSYHKRYAYVTAHGASSAVATTADATISAGALDQGDVYYFKFGTDYKSSGNLSSISGQSNNKIDVGDANTAPSFFLPDQIVKINYRAENEGTNFTIPTGYILVKIKEVTAVSNTHQILKTEVVKGVAAAKDLMWASASAPVSATYNLTISDDLEPKRCYVVGNAHKQGSGYPESWKDQPYSSAFGLTQIWKTAMAMDNTTRATVLKYEPNEFARIWRTKLIEHKFDIEQSLLFGSQDTVDGVQYTEGAVNFITNYGNIFAGSGIGGTGSKSQDDFLDDMSQFLDPRYNNANATLFMCSTDTYNWMHKLSGYFSANVQKVGVLANSLGRADFSIAGKKNVYGLDVTQVMTPYGAMNLTRNIHLDGTDVKILAINMTQCAYRPLVGNGLNRDTAVYVGVQTLENSGVDRRVDLIQTEAGMEWKMPESHAVWLKSVS